MFERRYELGRLGTFISTNLETKDFVADETVAKRLLSRCAEMFFELDFKDSIDWRQRINHRRVELARKYLLSRFPEPRAAESTAM